MQPSARETSQGVLVPPRLQSAQRSISCRQPWGHQGAQQSAKVIKKQLQNTRQSKRMIHICKLSYVEPELPFLCSLSVRASDSEAKGSRFESRHRDFFHDAISLRGSSADVRDPLQINAHDPR